jgi:tRNA U34 5-methylaminomethyl-2-thiouridine-forming methyltransferase MnmC
VALKIITTSDGSHSLLNDSLNETYHSVHGAIQESQHVFIKNGLVYFQQQNAASVVSIFEVGFGTGLNALLTLLHAETHAGKIVYTTIEADPLEEEIWSKLNYCETLGRPEYYQALHKSKWDSKIFLYHDFTLQKLHSTLEESMLPAQTFDVIYFDAFAPSKQPELWGLSVLTKIFHAMKQGGIFITYCAKGQLKRDLISLGLKVETLAGPPGKKEMVRATKG